MRKLVHLEHPNTATVHAGYAEADGAVLVCVCGMPPVCRMRGPGLGRVMEFWPTEREVTCTRCIKALPEYALAVAHRQ